MSAQRSILYPLISKSKTILNKQPAEDDSVNTQLRGSQVEIIAVKIRCGILKLRSHDNNRFIMYTQKTTLGFETVKFSDTGCSE